jgi:hypothetical protein
MVLIVFYSCTNPVVCDYEEAYSKALSSKKKLLIVFDCKKACSGSGNRARQLLDSQTVTEFREDYVFTYLLTDDNHKMCLFEDDSVDCDAFLEFNLIGMRNQPRMCIVDPQAQKAIAFNHWITNVDSLYVFLRQNK